MSRQTEIEAFLNTAGWAGAVIEPLAGDASNRRYDRLSKPDQARAVLMDAPPDRGENVRPFINIAKFLRAQGFSAPEIFQADERAGFLLIEDLGDRLFAREMAKRPDMQRPLYEAAVDVLISLHACAPPPLLSYDAQTTVPLAGLAYDWYLKGASPHSKRQDQKTRFSDCFSEILVTLDAELNVLIQRDYHVENLMWLPERDGVARVGLLDFQDAMIGHPAYDLVSILQDARRDVPADIQQYMLKRFVAKTGREPREFARAYAVFGVQRNLRILGVFSRLCMRNGKDQYVDLIPRVWRHLQGDLAHPALAKLATIVNRDLPPPDAAVLKQLKDRSSTCQNQS